MFDAPCALVFEAFLDPKHIVNWWGPNGFTTTTFEMDVKPGGIWRFMMHGPDGVDYPNTIRYEEIAKPTRLVFDHLNDQGGAEFRTTVTLAPKANRTEMTFHMVFKTAELRNMVAEKHHAVEGAHQTLARLADYIAQNAKRTLVLTRVIDAPRKLVYKIWTDPKHVAQWWGPEGFTNPVCELDAREGGAMLIHMRGPDGVVYPMTGTFHELVEPERIVFSSGALDAGGTPMFEVETTVTFAEHEGKTKLTVEARVTKSTAAAAPSIAGMEMGWTQTIDRLGAYAEQQRTQI
jgi:uncharacterized protein YndB with AHSA1/START domain